MVCDSFVYSSFFLGFSISQEFPPAGSSYPKLISKKKIVLGFAKIPGEGQIKQRV